MTQTMAHKPTHSTLRRIEKYCRVLILCILLASCGDDTPTAPDDAKTVTVMTWNVYIGGDVQTAFTSLDNPLLLPAEVSAFWERVNTSDFPSRARSIASIIAREQPHLSSGFRKSLSS